MAKGRHRNKVWYYVFQRPSENRQIIQRHIFKSIRSTIIVIKKKIWKYFCWAIISNLPLCIYNYMSFLPAEWKLQTVIKLVLCWKMCTLTTQQLQKMWPEQLQAPCKTMVVEDIPSTTLEKTNTHIQNGLMKITQTETELPHKKCYELLAHTPLKSKLESVGHTLNFWAMPIITLSYPGNNSLLVHNKSEVKTELGEDTF